MEKKFKVDNAVIMAAGMSSRFSPLSFEKHKGLITVKKEVLVERQIKQLQSVGINDIYIVTGYKSKDFNYLIDKFNVKILFNDEYLNRNNNSSIKVASKIIKNTYICSVDNYFNINPFEKEVDSSYYSACYANGETDEWCINVDTDGRIKEVTIGGRNSWHMYGHAFWSEEFSGKYLEILDRIYDLPETRNKFWESIFVDNLTDLPMKMRKYETTDIYEFDSIDELRCFDKSYIDDTQSTIIASVAKQLNVKQAELFDFKPLYSRIGEVRGFTFQVSSDLYSYSYDKRECELIKPNSS